MRQLLAGIVFGAVVALAGCVPPFRWDHRPAEVAAGFDPFRQPADESQIFVDSAVIERPADDAYCTAALWDVCDEQCVGLERLALFEENGLRVGRLTAPLPAKLQNMLNSRRSCTGPRRQRSRPGEPIRVALGGRRGPMTFEVQGKERRKIELRDATGYLEIIPRWDGERLTVHITPVVTHGVSQPRPTVESSPEGSLRWALDTREPMEELRELSFELVLEPGEYLLFGPRGDNTGSVGPALLTHPEDDSTVGQWVLVRAVRPRSAEPARIADCKNAPLALQAGYSAARGQSK
jgi:hypothetical protein